MRQFKSKSCIVCGTDFIPTGSCCKVCATCRPSYNYQREQAWKRIHTPPSGVGKGGNNKRFTDHPQYSSGIGNFHKLKKVMKATINACQRCNKNLSEVGPFEWCVHHKDRNRTHNTPDNLELLCKRCHQLEHDCVVNLPN